MFELVPDLGRRFLRIDMTGYWDAETMSRYEAAVRDALRGFKIVGGCKALLIDLSQLPLQARDTVDRHQALLNAASEMPSLRVAVVVQSALSKLQTLRVTASAGSRIFDTEAEALDWLFARGSGGGT